MLQTKPLRIARCVRRLYSDMRKKATNLTISDEIRHRAQHLMDRRGFSSFSAFVEQLIRESWEHSFILPAQPAPVNSTSALAEAKAAIVKTVEREVSYRTGKAQAHKPHPKKATK